MRISKSEPSSTSLLIDWSLISNPPTWFALRTIQLPLSSSHELLRWWKSHHTWTMSGFNSACEFRLELIEMPECSQFQLSISILGVSRDCKIYWEPQVEGRPWKFFATFFQHQRGFCGLHQCDRQWCLGGMSGFSIWDVSFRQPLVQPLDINRRLHFRNDDPSAPSKNSYNLWEALDVFIYRIPWVNALVVFHKIFVINK